MSAILPGRWTEYFDRLVAPRPALYVFPGVDGLMFARAEEPVTRQLIMGMSIRLFDAVGRRLFEETGDSIEDRCVVTWCARGQQSVTVPLKARDIAGITAQSCALYGDPINHRLTLTPKPLTL